MGIRDEIRCGGDIAEESVLAKIRAGTDNRRGFDWPGNTNVRVFLRLLSAKEITSAKFANQREFKQAGIDIAIHNLPDYREQEADHILWRALIDADGKRLFSSVDDFRCFCSREEIVVLSREYNALSDECDPGVDAMDQESLNDLLELVKKKPDIIVSRVSSLPTAHKLLHILVSQPVS